MAAIRQDNLPMTHYLVIFAAGFAGSFHCIGMCGGFACALGRDTRGGSATVLRHLLYNTGRLTTYCFLGGLAGAFGQVICTAHGVTATPLLDGSMDVAQRTLAIVAGLLMIAMALQFFGWLQAFHRLAIGFGGSTLAMSLRSLLTARNPAAPLAFGVFNGFLPCPLVYAFIAQAASTAEALSGVLVMVAFGLGTFPAMLMMGGVGRVLVPAWRQRGVWLAGCCILVLGLITLARGLLPSDAHIGHSFLAGLSA
jgi:sulfite exporter TauE/SafE